jgi:hypothetical protein
LWADPARLSIARLAGVIISGVNALQPFEPGACRDADSAGAFLAWLPGVFRREECAALVRLSRVLGFEDMRDEGAWSGPRGYCGTAGRSQGRAAAEDTALAAVLWERVALHLPEQAGAERASGLNERLRFYRYRPGQGFPAHTDGFHIAANGSRSRWTFLLYLTECYGGGATEFPELQRSVRGRPGDVLLFSHGLWHAGGAVTRGQKVVLRSDVMFPPEAH